MTLQCMPVLGLINERAPYRANHHHGNAPSDHFSPDNEMLITAEVVTVGSNYSLYGNSATFNTPFTHEGRAMFIHHG